MLNTRRRFMRAMLGTSALLVESAMAANALTPSQSTGPFYPSALPPDHDNDLVLVKGSTRLAAGVITNLTGAVIDSSGIGAPGVSVEIWQCNYYGRYHHERDSKRRALDPNFQGYGLTTTDDMGRYRFRTIKPVAYPGRAPHIHFKVRGPNIRTLITQLYINGHPDNPGDMLFRHSHNPELLTAKFTADESTTGWLRANFDIYVGAG